MMKNIPRFTIFIFGFAFFLSGCRPSQTYIKCEGMIWNTLYHITYKGPVELRDSILPVLEEVGKSLSVFDKNSLVSQLNRSDSLRVDNHLQKIYDVSRHVNELSSGKFDPTVSPLVNAWGFGLGHQASADTLAIDSILNFVGIGKTNRKDNLIVKDDPRIQFNFSAIAKGYGCDAVGEMLRRNGVEDFMVEIGGEVALAGKSPSGEDWRIAIDAPVENKKPGEETAMILCLTDCGIATSGNYRNYREEGAIKVAHTISPLTGRPFFSEILSATVIASTCMEADALATALMASEPGNAKKILQLSGTQGLLIFEDSIWMSPGFSKFISK